MRSDLLVATVFAALVGVAFSEHEEEAKARDANNEAHEVADAVCTKLETSFCC